jgi:hypothetical protein
VATEYIKPVGASRIPVVLRTYPKDDDAFRYRLEVSLAQLARVRDLRRVRDRLERLLALEFPAARVRFQDPLASDTGVPVLYAFRDGGLLNGDDAAAATPTEPEPEPMRLADPLESPLGAA